MNSTAKSPTEKTQLFSWKDCNEFSIEDVHNLYREYVNPGQVELLGSFGFGRTLMKSAEGMFIETVCGKKILDFTGGVGVLHHGHNHPRIIAARKEYAAQGKAEVHKSFLSPYLAALSHNIASLLPGDLSNCFFCNSGAESVEGAVKLAYKYHAGTRSKILTGDISFHGKLLGTGGLTGSPELTFDFPTIPDVHHFRYGDIKSVKDLVSKFKNENGNSDIYAILVEPMNASSLKCCSESFLVELRNLCDTENIILIFDEVYTAWAKTGELFFFMHYNVIPDIVTYSKSFGGGKASISGYTTRKPVFTKAYGNLQHAILHSTTYNGFGEECITALEAISIINDDHYVQRAQDIHSYLFPKLLELQNKHPEMIDEVRGRGALNGIILNKKVNMLLKAASNIAPLEFVRDSRFWAKIITGSVISELFNSHNILTFYGDNRETPLIISPSLIATKENIDQFCHALDQTLNVGKTKLVTNFLKFKFLSR